MEIQEQRHELTDAQLDYLRPLADTAARVEREMGRFVDYIIAEKKLPAPPTGAKWGLKLDPKIGKPYLAPVPKEG